MLSDINKETEQKMQKSLDVLGHDLARIRTGRAHPSLLDGMNVEYYGTPTPLNQVATINVQDSQTLTVTPFDKSMTQAIDKVIRTSELGLNPATSGNIIRVPLPPLTEERRKTLIKQVKSEVENTKVAIRNIRRDSNNKLKSLLKDKQISEDEDRQEQDKVQKITDKFIAKTEELAGVKESELMQI